MPALPAAAKVVKCALVWSDGVNTDIVSRFFVRYAGVAPTDANLASFASAIADAYLAHLVALPTPSVSLTRVECVDLSSSTSAAADSAAATPGTNAGEAVPIDVAVVISYILGRRYRGGHPRGYFPFGSGNDLTNLQTWSGAFVAQVDAAWTAFFVAVEAAGWAGAGTIDHVNVSYYHGFTVVTNPITGRARNVPTPRGAPIIDAVSTHIVRAHIGTQRRRVQY